MCYKDEICYENEILCPILNNGKIFDFFPKSGHPMIMFYRPISKEILVNTDSNQLVFGRAMKRKEIRSVSDLRQVFDELICQETRLINKRCKYNMEIHSEPKAKTNSIPFRIDIEFKERELIIDQLIFDILADKYYTESPKITQRQYSIYQGQYNLNGQTKEQRIESVRRCISNGLNKQTKNMNSPNLRWQITEMGVEPDKYLSYYNQVSTPFSDKVRQIRKRSKVEWDYIYYNSDTKLITGKQYDRSFSKHRNYSHNAFLDLYNACDQYIDEVFMNPPENSKDYFLKSLDFYNFEIYKRLDFIYKFAVQLDKWNLPKIEKECPLVKRFHPMVCYVLDQKGLVKFDYRIAYYRPMLMLETVWLQKLPEEPEYIKWQKYHFIRAKIFELFKYHFRFLSDDYDEISDFIKTHYNILDYHDSNKIWIQTDKKLKRECEARIIRALEVNEALFGCSDK